VKIWPFRACALRNASGYNYGNTSFIMDVAIGQICQIPRSTERISSYYYAVSINRNIRHDTNWSKFCPRYSSFEYKQTRLPSNLRPATRECVHLVTRGNFRSREKDGGHTIWSAKSENTMLHANLYGLSGLHNCNKRK